MTIHLADAPFTTRMAVDYGVDERELTSLHRSGALLRPSKGLYLPAHLAGSLDARVAALNLVLPAGAAVARETAAWLLGVDVRPPGRWREPPLLECLVPLGAARPNRTDIRAHISDLPTDDIIDVSGVPATSPTRTALDLARYRPRFMGLGAVDAFTHAGLTSVAELERATRELKGHRYIRRAREVIDLCEPATESMGESWTRLRVVEAGLPRPQVQISLRNGRGLEVYRLDMGLEEYLIGIEYDGVEHHLRTPAQQAHDDARRADIHARFGWTVLSATAGDIFSHAPRLEAATMELMGISIEMRRRHWG